jgi:DNA-binding IclR family transcriptional regulator
MTFSLSTAISAFLFLGCLALIFSEKLHRTIVAVAGAVLMVIAGLILGFYNEAQALSSIDFNTLGLLFGMMLLVAMLEPNGFFEFLAVWVGKMSKGKAGLLLFLLALVTSLVSMFLDNFTTVVLIAPVTILICEILGFSPQPFLISEAILSNIGGISTLVGDPPNVLIASAAGFTFVDFIVHSFPLIIVVWFSAYAMLSWMFRKELRQPSPNAEAVQSLNPQEAYTDQPTAQKVLIVIGIAVIFFFLEEFLGIRPEIIALGGRALRSNDLRSAGYAELEWLASAAGEAATLEILVDDQVLILEEIPASHLLAPWQTIGTRHPAHATSTGKLLLAFLPPHERTAHLHPPLQRITEKTIIDLEALEKQMALIRAQGYATAIEELEDGYVAVSAPVRNHDGEVVAAVSIGGPITRLNAGRLPECIELVRQAGRRISERLGFREHLAESVEHVGADVAKGERRM